MLRFWDIPVVLIDTTTRQVSRIVTAAELDADALAHLLADQVLPRLIAHDRVLVLHAGAVRHQAGAIVVLGDSGLGKSTLVGSLASAEHPIMSDDAMIVTQDHGGVKVSAVYPGLRLLPDSIAALFPGNAGTDPVADYTDKLRVRVGTMTEDGRHPVGLLAFLEPPANTAAITLRRLSPSETCMALISNSFSLDPTDKAGAAGKLAQASAIAAKVPAYALGYPRDYARLKDVHQVLLDQMARINADHPLKP